MSLSSDIDRFRIITDSTVTPYGLRKPSSRYSQDGLSTEESHRVSKKVCVVEEENSCQDSEELADLEEAEFSFLSSKMSDFNRDHDFGDSLSNSLN